MFILELRAGDGSVAPIAYGCKRVLLGLQAGDGIELPFMTLTRRAGWRRGPRSSCSSTSQFHSVYEREDNTPVSRNCAAGDAGSESRRWARVEGKGMGKGHLPYPKTANLRGERALIELRACLHAQQLNPPARMRVHLRPTERALRL